MVQVHHDEGVANRIDPESCADTREGIGEALTGERIGQPLSRESTLIPGADVVPLTEGNTDGRDNASAQTARRGLSPFLSQATIFVSFLCVLRSSKSSGFASIASMQISRSFSNSFLYEMAVSRASFCSVITGPFI